MSEKSEDQKVVIEEEIDADGEPLPEGIFDGYNENLKHAREEAKNSRVIRRIVEFVDRWNLKGESGFPPSRE